MLRGLWKDISGLDAEIHMRTDANNLVSAASTTHSPEQQETHSHDQMLRKEACSGAIADLVTCSDRALSCRLSDKAQC